MAAVLALTPDPYILLLTGAGFLIALVAWLPLALRRLPLSLPIVCIGLGAAVFALPQVTLRPLPMDYLDFVRAYEHFNDPEWDGKPLPPG